MEEQEEEQKIKENEKIRKHTEWVEKLKRKERELS